MINGTAVPTSHQPDLRVRSMLRKGRSGNRVTALYLVSTARPASTPAPANCHQFWLFPKARSQNTSDQIQKVSMSTSHISVELETRNTGVKMATTVASSGLPHHILARE